MSNNKEQESIANLLQKADEADVWNEGVDYSEFEGENDEDPSFSQPRD